MGALGAFLTAVVGYATGIFKLGPLAIAAAVLGVMLLISLPSVVLAYITLRKRNLGPILDANGWAVNANAKINVAFGTTLTGLAKLPAGSRRDSKIPTLTRGFLGSASYSFLSSDSGLSLVRRRARSFPPAHLHSASVLGKFAPEKPAPSIPPTASSEK